MMVPYPILLHPAYKDYLWGGNRIAELYNREITTATCAESWEISDRPEGMGIVSNGEYAGRSLADLIAAFGTDLTGTACPGTHFPLLVKVIDAAKDLSVQVHPNDQNAHLTGGEPKTEMWIILAATPQARIYAGLKPGTTRESFMRALEEKRLADEVLASVPARPGDAIFVPGGRVHAIGAGCLLLEVQQNSNTTYRVYDWDRVDSKGQARELHLEQAMKVIDWENAQPEVITPREEIPEQNGKRASILATPYFSTERIFLSGPIEQPVSPERCEMLFVTEGRVEVRTGEHREQLGTGQSCLLPAISGNYAIRPCNSAASVIRIRP